MTATTGPTLLEELHALEVTAHRLATERDHALAEQADLLEANLRLQAERDCAMQMAGQAAKDLVRVRTEMQARLDVRDALITSLRAADDSKNDDLRRLNARIRELAVENEDLREQRKRDQQEAPPVRKSWLSRRIGNQL